MQRMRKLTMDGVRLWDTAINATQRSAKQSDEKSLASLSYLPFIYASASLCCPALFREDITSHQTFHISDVD